MMGTRSLRYFGQKLRLAEQLQEHARHQELPLRAVLGSIATSEKGVFFRKDSADHSEIKADIRVEPEQGVSLKDIAHDLLSQEHSHRLYAGLLPQEKVAVDFSSPNIAKPFHVGHLSSTIIGNYLCNLKRRLGDVVVAVNYLGDWGTQFGMLSAGFRRFGNEELLKNEPLKHLLDIYVESNKLAETDKNFNKEALEDFAKLERGDETVKKLWFKLRHISLTEYVKLYTKLGIKFDVMQGESSFHLDSQELIRSLNEKRILEESRDLHGIFLDSESFVPLVKSNGSTLYMTRDICAALSRQRTLDVDTLYYVVDNSQAKHFSDLQKCLDKISDKPLKIIHVKFGRIRGLSTRTGEVVLLEDLIGEAQHRAIEGMKATSTTRVEPDAYDKTSLELALAALYVNTLKARRQRNEKFDWDRCFSLKGDSGISLQYCHARLCSLIETTKVDPVFHEEVCNEFLQDDNVRKCLCLLGGMEECLLRSDARLEPCVLVNYLFKLCHSINKTLRTARVGTELNKELAETRMSLFNRLRDCLADGLKLVGTRPLSKM